MRHFSGWLFAAILICVPAFGQAATLFAPNLGQTLVLRLFGEVSDGTTSLVSGNVAFDSPLREAAFVVSADASAPAPSIALVRVPRVRTVTLAHFVYVAPRLAALATRVAGTTQQPIAPSLGLGVTSDYQGDTGPAFFDDASTAQFSFTGASSRLIPAFVTQSALSAQPATDPTLDQNLLVPLAVRVGNFRMLAGLSAGFSSTPSSGVDNTLPVFVPTYANVSRSSLGANLAVPLAPRLVVGVGYNTEQILTGYGVPLDAQGLDGRNDTYSGNLTFLFPRLSSALSLSAQQYRYQDNLIPAEYTQLRGDLNLTVKF